jgi:3-isopropylmalate dehydratase small subunit
MEASIMSVIQSISGKMIPLLGEDIDTDRIVPARFLKEVTFEKMGDYLFYDVRYDSAGNETDFVLNRPEYKEGSILVVGSNFGCGSSREHAPQAIKRYGIRAIVGACSRDDPHPKLDPTTKMEPSLYSGRFKTKSVSLPAES